MSFKLSQVFSCWIRKLHVLQHGFILRLREMLFQLSQWQVVRLVNQHLQIMP